MVRVARRSLIRCVLPAPLLFIPALAPAAVAMRMPSVATTLVYGGTQEPDTLNPLLTQTAAGRAIASAVFEGLLRVDNSDRLQPGLARSWQRSADGLTWTFHLRHGITFADGVNLTSTDVYWTYLAILNPIDQAVTTQGWNLIDRMTTPDRFTVVMHLKQWLAPWLLEIGTTPILPKHALYQHPTMVNQPFNRTPFGTGPYLVREWQPGDHITLVANPHYWQGPPHIHTIIYRFFLDDAHLLAALRSGSVRMGQVDPRQVAVAAHIAYGRIVETPSMTWYHIDLKQWGLLRRQRVRQALDYATPKAALVKDILSGHGRLATGDISPWMTDYYNPKTPEHGYDPRRAAEILAADGFRRGPEGILQRCTKQGCVALRIALWSIQGDSFSRQVNARLAHAWGALGIGVTLHTAPVDQIFGPMGPQFSREMTGITYGWTNGDDPDDRFYWNSAYIPASPTASGGNGVAFFYRFSFQAEIDALTNAGVLETDPARRRGIYDRIQNLLGEQAPVIFLYWEDTITLVPHGLQGFLPSPFTQVFWNVAQWR
jgi:peptide/nickel transport system substrate-binding protein